VKSTHESADGRRSSLHPAKHRRTPRYRSIDFRMVIPLNLLKPDDDEDD
jgi:hypothetical protein